jgi:hypothetical protein
MFPCACTFFPPDGMQNFKFGLKVSVWMGVWQSCVSARKEGRNGKAAIHNLRPVGPFFISNEADCSWQKWVKLLLLHGMK